jgi:hypothetical protein
MRQVIPPAPKFIRNEDGNKKQDCERNAVKRLLYEIKQDHPHLHIRAVCRTALMQRETGSKIIEKLVHRDNVLP